MVKRRIKILFCAYECAPFFKRGGLGDVALGLPKALSDLGHEVKVIIPKYRYIDARKWKVRIYCRNVPVSFGKKTENINIYRSNLPKNRAIIYFIDHPIFKAANLFDKKSQERYIFFSKSILGSIKELSWKPDIIHANDWQTGALFVYLRKLKKLDPWYGRIGSLYTIHNLAFQGKGKIDFKKAGLENADFLNKKEFNLMSEGILGADLVNTVSKTYAQEILTKEYGQGLEKFLRKRKRFLHGIVNGLDKEYFDPSKDKELAARYSIKALGKKSINKRALQKYAKLPEIDVPVLAIISRLAWQKGFDLISEIMPGLLKHHNIQFIALGHGRQDIARALKGLEKEFKTGVRAFTFFGPPKLAKLIYAGADMFLMPSRYEPCGLSQLISMRYGTVPIVRQTGGLNDTVKQVKGSKGTGFVFKKYQAEEFEKAILQARRLYKKPRLWKKIQINGMRYDSTWNASAREYTELYKKIIKKYASRN